MAFIWTSLLCRTAYLQGRNRDADVENGPVGTKWRVVGWKEGVGLTERVV